MPFKNTKVENFFIVLKVHADCNLRCTYCYEYEPPYGREVTPGSKRMSASTFDAMLKMIMRHKDNFPSDQFDFALHGGEPFLWGRSNIRRAVKSIRTLFPESHIGIQTNGTIIDRIMLDEFLENNVKVSVSSDGTSANRRFRLDKLRRSSKLSERTPDMIRILVEEYPKIFAGVLAVVDPTEDPSDVLEEFCALGVKSVDFLLPLNDQRISNEVRASLNQETSKYFDRLLDCWISRGFASIAIRIFTELFLARKSSQMDVNYCNRLDAFGGDISRIFTVEPDGAIQDLDINRRAGPFRAALGTVFDSDVSDVRAALSVRYANSISPTCKACEYYDMCGGGYLPHRFDGHGFSNPSVYCDTLKAICRRVSDLAR